MLKQLFASRLSRTEKAVLVAINLLLAPLLLWIVAVNVFHVPYHIGVDGQKERCLPWSVFLIKRAPPGNILPGDLLQFKAADIGHGFSGLVFIKQVAGVPGDRIRVSNDTLYINDRPVDNLWLVKTLGKKTGDFDRSFTVPPGEYFMMGTTPQSFDGRYWGTIHASQILGSATPLF